MRVAARVDANHAEIVQALRDAGWRVASTARMGKGFPDLMVWHPRYGWRAVEIKTPRGRLTADQVRFLREFDSAVVVIRSADEARRLR